MRIIKVTRGTVEAERRLVAAMLNMEHAARLHDNEGKALPAPHENYPTVKVAPRTEKGLPVVYHYKPSVGVVYYSAADGFNVPALLLRLKAALAAHGDAHLRAYRSVAVGPCATIRQKNRTATGTEVVGPRQPYKKRPEDAGVGPRQAYGKRPEDAGVQPSRMLPSRMLLYTPSDYVEPPPHVSYRAAFTWVFMNGAGAVNLEAGNISQFNAAVASVFYDTASILALGDGDEVYSIKPAELKVAMPIVDLKDLALSRRGYEALLIERSGDIVVVGHGSALLGDRRGALQHASPEVKWGSVRTTNTDLGEYNCLLCSAPLWGQVFILFDPKEPATPQELDGFIYSLQLRAKQPILGDRGAAICRYCSWSIPHCAPGHLQCRSYSSSYERSQAAALRGSPLEYLLPIVAAGRATPVPGMPGMFSVAKPGGKPQFILTSYDMPSFVELGYPNLLALGVPIVRFPHIVEAY